MYGNLQKLAAIASRSVLTLIAIVACAGCPFALTPGDGPDSLVAPTVEHELSLNPSRPVTPDSLIALVLEAGETHAGDLGEIGMDAFPILISERTQLNLSIELDDELSHAIVIRDQSGQELGRHTNGTDVNSVVLAPGDYFVEVHHGDPVSGDLRGVFVRWTATSAKRNVARQTATTDNGAVVHELMASHRCDGCDLTHLAVPTIPDAIGYLTNGALLTNCRVDRGIHGQLLGLANATFDNCSFVGSEMSSTWFFGVKIRNSDLRQARGLTGEGVVPSPGGYEPKWSRNCLIENCNLSGMDLNAEGTVFTGQHPINRDGGTAPNELHLSNSNLSGVIFPSNTTLLADSCQFTQADFTLVSNAWLTLKDCDLSTAQFSTLGGLVLRPSSLENVQLNDRDLRALEVSENTSFTNVSFSGADLTGARVFFLTRFQDCDFSGADLTGAWVNFAQLHDCDMAGANLSEAEFPDSTLDGCNFVGADLAGATFERATLTNGRFAGMDLQNVNFADVVSLAGSDFSNANVAGVAFGRASLAGAMFANANLVGAHLAGANLAGADFTDAVFSSGSPGSAADLSGAALNEAVFLRADLSHASLAGAVALGASFEFSNLFGADLSHLQAGVATGDEVTQTASFSFAYMVNANLESADLRAADFSGAHLYGEQSNLNNALLDRADFAAGVLSSADFGTASLVDAVFNGAQLVNCSLVGANLMNAKFDSAYLQGANFSQAVLHGTNFTNAAFATGSGSWSFRDRDGLSYSIAYGPTTYDPAGTATSICPDGGPGGAAGCVGARLTPQGIGPFPPIPACVPSPTAWCPSPSR